MIDENVLTRALHELADRDDTGIPPVAGLLRRGHRARLGRAARTATVAAMAGVLVPGGMALAVVRPGSGASGPVPLALAAHKTAETTFHYRFDETLAGLGHAMPWEGRYDPVHDRGYAWTGPIGPQGITFEERQIGADCYLRSPQGQWFRSRTCGPITGSPETASLGESASPGDLLAQLKSAGKVSYAGRTGKGHDAIDTYQFTYTEPSDGLGTIKNRGDVIRTGTVDIDVTSQRIVKVSYRLQYSGRPQPIPVQVDLQLDDFGTPVDVSPPANPIPVTALTPSTR